MSDQAEATQAAPTPRQAPVNIQDVVARGLAKAEAAAAQQGEAAAPVQGEAAKPVEQGAGPKPLPKREPIKPRTTREAVLARTAGQEDRKALTAAQQAHQAELAKVREESAAATAQLGKLKAAFDAGDVEGVVRLVGFENYEAAQKLWLAQRGAVPKEDPRIGKLEQELAETKKLLTSRAQQEQAAREAQELNERQRGDWNSVQAELAASEYERLPELSKKNWFVNHVLQLTYQNPQVDSVEHWAQADDAYGQLYKELHEIYGAKAAPVEQQAVAPRGQSAATGVPQRGSAEASAGAPKLSDVRRPGAMNLKDKPAKLSPKEHDTARQGVIDALIARLPT